jgi:hypothetical protein
MAINYPKFDQKINDQIQTAHIQKSKTRLGTIAQYNRSNNTAVIILESSYSDMVGNIINNVSCPIVYRSSSCCPRTR